MTGMIEWFLTQVDEDEQVAAAATAQGVRDLVSDNMDQIRVVRHVAYWEPDRVLALLRGFRRLLVDAQNEGRDTIAIRSIGEALYASRRGYRDRWRPGP